MDENEFARLPGDLQRKDPDMVCGIFKRFEKPKDEEGYMIFR